MIDPITYLYYRIYKIYNRIRYNGEKYDILFAVIIAIYSTSIVALIKKEFPADIEYLVIGIFSYIVMSILSRKREKIVKKYDNMTVSKKIGNLVFFIEIVIAIVSLVFIMRV